jgi:hypothetical protein
MSYGAPGAMQFNGFTGTMIPTMTRIQNKGIVYQPKTDSALATICAIAPHGSRPSSILYR